MFDAFALYAKIMKRQPENNSPFSKERKLPPDKHMYK